MTDSTLFENVCFKFPGQKPNIASELDAPLASTLFEHLCSKPPPPWWETEHSCAAGLLLDLSRFDHVCLKAPGGPHNIVVRQTTMVDTTLFEWVRSKAPSAKQNSPVAQGSVLHT